ncbi:competence/damage-inducible protein A [Salegentibacter mishustinae]|uniref:competence/damage-inducible protein A n=1 Tax=Salegentibacter mishustinae TaxID=270918 RepID=UPI001CE206AD|nr:competence/damage-inducible protein A [Salegentibacter mishustinae]UBZ05900.1 competence/damage-inducible protein A [Salegentibacter mishustinae]
MKAEIITVGDEILIGQIVDTNSAFIAKELNKIGISVKQISTVEDERSHILEALNEAKVRADIIIITGGLGPTKDDITKDCLCEFFEDKLVNNEEVLKHIEFLFEKYIDTPISDLNRKQAMLPSKALALMNKFGTAPGMWFESEGKAYVSLPGVPFEMKALIEDEVIPRLQQNFKRPVILHKTVLTYGMGESAIAEKIEAWEDGLPPYIRLAYLPNLGRVRLRLTAKGDNEEHLKNSVESLISDLHSIIGDIIVGYEDDEPVEIQISRLLLKNKSTIATAESCTGGRLGSLFATPPGASNYYKGSVVSYATSSKVDVLKIDKKLIEEHSVVSEEVAMAMAKNVREIFKTDYAISTTGNAGPAKGDSDADIGTVFIGIATPDKVYAKKFTFGNHRDKVIGKAVNKSIELIRDELFQQVKTHP